MSLFSEIRANLEASRRIAEQKAAGKQEAVQAAFEEKVQEKIRYNNMSILEKMDHDLNFKRRSKPTQNFNDYE